MSGSSKQRKKKADLATILRKSWYHLRLSVRHPTRVPTWDAILLTAASPEQAELYEWQLRRAKRMGRIAESTVTLAVPDPDGKRIGSGAATLNAIYALALHYQNLGFDPIASEVEVANGSCAENMKSWVRFLSEKHVLMLHAGGDSKRVPWANPMGKVFLPLPFLASDDPDGPVPLLFDHILAVASCARQAFGDQGGLFIMTGDVLPCFDAFKMTLPEDSASIVTVPITLDIASNHGVIVTSKSESLAEGYTVSLVNDLLQKPTVEELVKKDAILHDGRTLLDTGIISARGRAWLDLVALGCSCQPMISELLGSKKEMSLYEDLVAAWVPSRHDWLRTRPLGEHLVNSLGRQKMYSYCTYDLQFLHFGTSSEVLDHLSGDASGIVGRRHLCSIPATTVSDIAASSVILSSEIAPGVSIGEDSLIYDSTVSGAVQIGSQSVVVGIHIPSEAPESFRFMLPDRHCLWEVPLVGHKERVIVYCGLHDNPKNSIHKDGTFCGKPLEKVLCDLGIEESDLWNLNASQDRCLWNAKMFPILTYSEMLTLASWLMGLDDSRNKEKIALWRSSKRVSLEELHGSINFPEMCNGSSNHQSDLAAGIAKACMNYGMLGRNLSQLCHEILQKESLGLEICKNFLDQCPKFQEQNSKILPKSRAYQVEVDLLRACGDEAKAIDLEHKVWEAVAEETASAVRYGFREHLLESSGKPPSEKNHISHLDRVFQPRRTKVELPVRVDFVGGWSDTPPWSLERPGCVLNMAITLEGSLPIGTIIETTNDKSGISIQDDAGNELHIEDPITIKTPFEVNDPFRLVKSALLVTGIVQEHSKGLAIKTWANVPRGSGLGTSSILAAAVVKGLLQISNGDESNENVARLVLVLEQLMGTGGGWQDQIGGLYPGIKFTSSFPGIPLRLQVVPLLASPQLVSELQQRLLVVFTGQVRLAHQVLHKVVTRYLQRDNLLISSIKRLTELHGSINFPEMCSGSSNHQADLAAGIAKACVNYGMLGRNLSQLCHEILQKESLGLEICKKFLDQCPKFQEQNSRILPKSRAYQVEVDLLKACGDEGKAIELEHRVWEAVAEETASAVRYGFREHLLESSGKPPSEKNHISLSQPRRTKVELPVRVDFVGGWSDTPPWSLERAGCVLNMAITLEGSLPIGTIIETTNEKSGISIQDDAGNELHIEDPRTIKTPFEVNDPFRLVKSALLVTGIVQEHSTGLAIKTWANVPRGSGLGTSSILAAAVVKGLLQISDGDESNENVARLVLVLEQLMGTGGGWQDQIGGLYSGIKFTSSFPGIPLRLQVVPLLASPQLVSELQQRLLVVFTGQVRLAHQVLHKVVTRYLQRDNLLISSIKRLTELAKAGREALMNCEVDELGEIMSEAWRLHQELDPYCSNEFVDKLFAFSQHYSSGFKLVGAGGGGFSLILAKDAEKAKELRQRLEEHPEFDVKIYNWSISL